MTNETISVCLCCDLTYLKYTCTTIASIAYNSKSKINFYILYQDISKNMQDIMKSWLRENFSNCSLTFLDVSPYLKELNVKQVNRFNSLVFGRYFIPELLPNVDKAIYLDSDIILLNDIAKLNKINIGENAVAGVYEYWQENIDWGNKIKNNLKYMNLSKKHRYFSSGVLVIDCQKWRQQNITQSLLETYNQYRELTQYPDQDPLNKLFENNYLELDPIYNTTEQTIIYFQNNATLDEYNFLKNNIVIRHFAGDNKPWNQVFLYKDKNNKDCSDNFNDWWFFASMTPFISSLENSFLEKQMIDFKKYNLSNIQKQQDIHSNNKYNISYKFLGIIPLFKVIKNKNKITYNIFDKIVLLKIKNKKNKTTYNLFGFLPLITIKKKEYNK